MNKWVRKSLLALGLYDRVVDFKKWIAREEDQNIDFYRQFINEGELCFDVGANVGRRTKTFLKLNARVVTVEPQPHCIKVLEKKYSGNHDVILVNKAVGEKQGEAEMMVCDAHSLSSLSKQWVDSVRGSGRYAQSNWEKRIKVPVTTLDQLISEYGRPVFMKIDVEGYEYEVVKGLSQPVKALCFELTPECVDSAMSVVKHLEHLGAATFNYCSSNRAATLALPQWVAAGQMCDVIESLRNTERVADVYVKFKI